MNNNKMPTDEDISDVIRLHTELTEHCKEFATREGMTLQQLVSACLITATAINRAINRADGSHSHAEMVKFLAALESIA